MAACRAALIATLLPDPGNEEARQKLLERLAGKVVKKVQKDGSIKEETEGGILHWGRESGPDLEYFREEIRKAYGGRAPKVLDPFAGGGAIPLEAMRLGCEATAIDINPVAWFILKCTLEYPQKLAGQKLPLPDFALEDPEFMAAFRKGTGQKKSGKKGSASQQMELHDAPEADLAWHVRAWGLWVLKQARKELAEFYPTYADWQPLQPGVGTYEKKPPRLVPLDAEGNADIETLNADYGEEYLKHPQNPRWVAKPTVAYLWARTVKCKNCRAVVPLLKTRWLCKKDKKRVVLEMTPRADRSGVDFAVNTNPPTANGNKAQQTALDKKLGAGTMSRSGAQCPCCNAIMTMEDIRVEGKAGRLGAVMTAVVVDGPKGKEYRLPQPEELAKAEEAGAKLEEVYKDIPFGLPTEPTPKGGNGASRAFSVDGYGLNEWQKLYVARQLLAIGQFVRKTRRLSDAMLAVGYPKDWTEGIQTLSVASLGRFVDYTSSVCIWALSEFLCHTISRYALPITWDFVEGSPLGDTSGNFAGATDWVCRVVSHLTEAERHSPPPHVLNQSAINGDLDSFDLVVTDPPYYDAIPYSDLMDFFYVWFRRIFVGANDALQSAFNEPLSPKWKHEDSDGELIDDAARFNGNRSESKLAYEKGMADAFRTCHQALNSNGRLVIVFAHKQPDAWETLASALVASGFVVGGSWPIQTERETSSPWQNGQICRLTLVC